MTLVLVHFRARMLELARSPGYVVPTIVLPTLFFVFFGIPGARHRDAANFAMTAYSVFAVLGVCFFQFGVRMAAERMNPWESYVRTLPLTPGVRYASVLLVALSFTAVAVLLVVIAAVTLTPASLAPLQWVRWSLSLISGSVPFVLFGIALGYLVPAYAAVPIANLVYLPLAFLGGLFIAPASLPRVAAMISRVTPSRHFAELAWSAILDQPVPLISVAWLVGYTIAFAWLATYAYHRFAKQRFA